MQRQPKYKELPGFQEKIEAHQGTEQVFLHYGQQIKFVKLCVLTLILLYENVNMDCFFGSAQTAFEKTPVLLAQLRQGPERLLSFALC